MSVLEAVLSDFSQMEAEMQSRDAEDRKDCEEAMKANEIEKAGRRQAVQVKTSEKKRWMGKIAPRSETKKNMEELDDLGVKPSLL